MISIHLTADDLTKMRFAYRPLLEIPLSYRVLINPQFQQPYARWVDEAFRAVHEMDLPYLSALVTDHGYIPDFLTPTPMSKRVDIEADFDDLLATPDELIRAGILELIAQDGDSEMRQYFLAYPHDALVCLVEDLRAYWQRTLAHYWTRMVSSLESDLLYKARLLALDGAGTVFDDTHSSVHLQQDMLQLDPVCQHNNGDVDLSLRGDGIQLVPLIFRGCGRMFQVVPGWQPMLAYGVRVGGLWYQQETRASRSLELALGAGRARVLQVLKTPASTSDVAFKARISASNASQHLNRLMKAGLVEPRRSGKWVYYHLTERGAHLLDLFDASN
jgi:DNA-binding transcriptional ArsR family regulator